MRLFLLVILLAAPAAAETVSGHLLDAMCAPKLREKAAAHTVDCLRKCRDSGFGLVTAEGDYLKFDEKGNVLAYRAIEELEAGEGVEVKAEGRRDGAILRVADLEIIPSSR